MSIEEQAWRHLAEAMYARGCVGQAERALHRADEARLRAALGKGGE